MDYINSLLQMPSSLFASKRNPNLPPKFYSPNAPPYVEKFSYKKPQFNLKNFQHKRNMSATPASVLPNGNVQLTNGNVVTASSINAATSAPTAPPSVPVAVQPTGNVQMSNGNVVPGSLVATLPNSPPNPVNTAPTSGSSAPAATLLSSAADNVAAATALTSQAQVSPPVSAAQLNASAANHLTQAAAQTSAAASQTPQPVSGALQSIAANHSNTAAVLQSNSPHPAAAAASASGSIAASAQSAKMAAASTNHPGVSAALMKMHHAGMSRGNQQCPIAPPSAAMQYCTPAPFHSEGGKKYFYVKEAYGEPKASYYE